MFKTLSVAVAALMLLSTSAMAATVTCGLYGYEKDTATPGALGLQSSVPQSLVSINNGSSTVYEPTAFDAAGKAVSPVIPDANGNPHLIFPNDAAGNAYTLDPATCS